MSLLCATSYALSNTVILTLFFKHVIHTGPYICRSCLLFSSPGTVHGSYTQSFIELGTYSFCNDFCVLMSFFSLPHMFSLFGMASYNSLANPIHSFQFTCHFTKPSLVDVIYKYKKYLFSGCYMQGTIVSVRVTEVLDRHSWACIPATYADWIKTNTMMKHIMC